MHAISQIWNCEDQREFQNQGTEHMRAPIHVLEAQKIEENDDSE